MSEPGNFLPSTRRTYTRSPSFYCLRKLSPGWFTFLNAYFAHSSASQSEDMIEILGKRPFASKDDMDRWLDEHHKQAKIPPSVEGEIDDPLPSPTPVPIAKALDDPKMLFKPFA